MLEIDKINVFYGEIQALWDVSLRVNENEIVALIGSNGAGKTTTLKAITGLLPVRSGKIRFLGRSIENIPTHKRVEIGITMVPEGRRLFPYMTVYENLRMGAYLRRASEKFEDTLEWIYGLFPVLKEFRDRLANTLSGGEQQMLAIARALMSRPKILLMDEPSLGLAPTIVTKLYEKIKELRESGVTILLVEQNVRNALEISDRTYVLESGRIILSGNSKELLHDERIKKAYLGIM
jgi:branched-chain amino acid transport system ATP-binding protein